MSKEYFGNLPMLNDGTCSETQSFLITETQMAIQTEVTLQKDYVLSACEGGKSQCIAEIVILGSFREQRSISCFCLSGITLASRAGRFGSPEFKPPLAPLFF